MVKLLRMKNLNLFLALALLALMYKTPLFLMDIADNMIGRAILIISLAFFVIRCDFSCAILFSLIIIVLLHNSVEGFIEGAGSKDEETEDDDKAVDADEAEAEADADEAEAEAEEAEAEAEDAAAAAANTVATSVTKGMEGNKETFIGGLLQKNLNKARKVLRSNITDLDRELKVGAERRSISATKQ